MSMGQCGVYGCCRQTDEGKTRDGLEMIAAAHEGSDFRATGVLRAQRPGGEPLLNRPRHPAGAREQQKVIAFNLRQAGAG